MTDQTNIRVDQLLDTSNHHHDALPAVGDSFAKKVVDQCLQLHGGYGYMLEYPIAQAWLDMRWGTIGGGTNEIMKDFIGREMGF